jgi:DNA-binding response OmpR family regulator
LQGRVAVVDDDPLVGEFMSDLLATWGLEVQLFSDPEQASLHLGADPYARDLVILDQSMPRLTGMQLARRLLAARADLPILLYTGFSDSLVEEDVRAQGVRAMLTKPLDQARLHALLGELLEAGSYRTETN